MHPKDFCRLGLISACPGERVLYEFFLELIDRLPQKDPAFNHFYNEGFQLFFHF